MVKKRYLAAALAGVVLVGAGVAAPAVAGPGDPVNFPDANFRACVNEALGQPSGAVITEAQAASITTLDCGFRGVADLTGAQSLTGAVLLSLYQSGNITDVSPLAGLTGLVSLNLVFNKIRDVSPLAGLTNLGFLGLSVNPLADLSPLAGLTNLTTLDARYQAPAMSVPCGGAYPNPVKNWNGTVVALTGAGYNAGSNTIDTTTEGTYQYTWNVPTLPGGGMANHFEGTLTVTVTCTPPAPVDDVAMTEVDTPVLIDVLANDGDTTGWTVTNATASHGTAVVTGDRKVSYTPAAGFEGTDTVTYTVQNAAGQTGSAKVVVSVLSAPVEGAVPVFRFYSPTFGGHFYTADEVERDFIRSQWAKDWDYEGQRYTAFPSQVPGTVPLYRFWSATLNGHFYTADEAERAFVEANWSATWAFEGVAYYVYPQTETGQADSTPVFRFWSDLYQRHFYTASQTERDTVIANWPDIWAYEGDRYRVPNTGIPTP